MFSYLFNKTPDWMKPFFWRMVLSATGLFVAILLLILGFWKTILVAIVLTISFIIGSMFDGSLELENKDKRKGGK